MDRTTALEIIKMINTKIDNLYIEYKEGMNDVEYHSRTDELSELRSDIELLIGGGE